MAHKGEHVMEKDFEIKLIYAVSPRHYMVKRVDSFHESSKEYSDLMEFIHEEERLSEEEYLKTHTKQEPVIQACVTISKYNSLTGMVQPFWGMLSKEEKIEIIKMVAEKYGGFEFSEMREIGIEEDGTLAAIYTDDENIQFNTTSLSYDIDPCYFLASILSAKNEVNQRVYENKNTPVKNILDFENIHELKTRLVMTHLDMEATEEEQQEWLKAYYEDMPIYRARKYAIIDAADMLMTEAEAMKPLTNEFIQNSFETANHTLSELREIFFILDATDEELATIQKLEVLFNENQSFGYLSFVDKVREILEVSDRRRDAWYVLNANDSLNADAEKENRPWDIVDQETALLHYGLSMKDVVFDEDDEPEEEQEVQEQTLDDDYDGFVDNLVESRERLINGEKKDDEPEDQDDDDFGHGPYMA